MAPYYSKLPVTEITCSNAEQLGSGGFCFLVAELLQAKYRGSVLWRLTDSIRTKYAHVFVCVEGHPADIKGFRSIDEMRFDYNDYSLVAEPIEAQSVRDFFYPNYTQDQLSAGRDVLRCYINTHNDIFPDRAQMAK